MYFVIPGRAKREPGIHNHRREYGFRACAVVGQSTTENAHPGMTPRIEWKNQMDLNLRGKRVLITGASKGIGAAAAEAFAEEGCDLLLVARSSDALDALAGKLRSAHQINAVAHACDLRKPDHLAGLARVAADIDILVNNAGDIPGGAIDKIDEAAWRHAWELKVFGYINLTRMIYAQMKARGHGIIVNDIGAAGEKFDANYICGSAGNAALMAFTRALGGKASPTISASSASIRDRSAPTAMSRC